MTTITRSWAFYAVLLALAALVNLLGYTLNLWHDRTVFDELVHAFTVFATVAALGNWYARKHMPAANVNLAALMMCAGLVLGVAWEAFEWLIGIIGNRHDTMMDLVMDMLGALLAAALLWFARSSN